MLDTDSRETSKKVRLDADSRENSKKVRFDADSILNEASRICSAIGIEGVNGTNLLASSLYTIETARSGLASGSRPLTSKVEQCPISAG